MPMVSHKESVALKENGVDFRFGAQTNDIPVDQSVLAHLEIYKRYRKYTSEETVQ